MTPKLLKSGSRKLGRRMRFFQTKKSVKLTTRLETTWVVVLVAASQECSLVSEACLAEWEDTPTAGILLAAWAATRLGWVAWAAGTGVARNGTFLLQYRSGPVCTLATSVQIGITIFRGRSNPTLANDSPLISAHTTSTKNKSA